jgi:hypothetical protein
MEASDASALVVDKFKADTTPEEMSEMVAGLRAMPGKISEMRRFAVGDRDGQI